MKNSSKYKFLIIASESAAYDARMVEGLKRGFESIGYSAAAIAHPMSGEALIELCKSQNFNVVIQVNGIKPAIDFPTNIRYVSWIQDVFLDTASLIIASPIRDGDILYTLGDPGLLGLNLPEDYFTSTLFTGVSQELLNYRHPDSCGVIDFSLCGYIPKKVTIENSLKKLILWHLDRLIASVPIIRNYSVVQEALLNPVAIIKMHDFVCAAYEPLTGSLDINYLERSLRDYTKKYSDLRNKHNKRKILTPFFLRNILSEYIEILNFSGAANLGKYDRAILRKVGSSAYDRTVNYFSQSFPRMIDRITLADLALLVSSSFEIYGSENWLGFPEFKKYYRGNIFDLNGLINVYKKSKINLSNNTHGLGIHSRVLECMAVGGFIFNHESPNDNTAGGMLTEFEPGVHFGQYSIINFAEESQKWLRDDASRMLVGENAKKIISKNHLWRHRAEKIINDLSR